MQRHMLKSKIHRATITAAELHYEGSLTVDEQVQIANVSNGERFSTYVIPGPRGSGVMQLNGAAARLGMPGDLVIVMSYAALSEAELEQHTPRVVFVDAQNRIVRPPLRAES